MAKYKRTTKPGEVRIRKCRLCKCRITKNWFYCDTCKKIIHQKYEHEDPVSDYDLHIL